MNWQSRFEEEFKATESYQIYTLNKVLHPMNKPKIKNCKYGSVTEGNVPPPCADKNCQNYWKIQSFKIDKRLTIPTRAWFSWHLLAIFQSLCCRFTSLSSAIYVVPVVIFTLIWNIPHFTELNTCYKVEWLKDYERFSAQHSSLHRVQQPKMLDRLIVLFL